MHLLGPNPFFSLSLWRIQFHLLYVRGITVNKTIRIQYLLYLTILLIFFSLDNFGTTRYIYIYPFSVFYHLNALKISIFKKKKKNPIILKIQINLKFSFISLSNCIHDHANHSGFYYLFDIFEWKFIFLKIKTFHIF